MQPSYRPPRVTSFDAGDLTELFGPALTQYGGMPQRLELSALADESGTINDSLLGTNVIPTLINAGDGLLDATNQGFAAFDLSSLPTGSTILDAELRLDPTNSLGDPFNDLGNLELQQVDYLPLDAADFGLTGPSLASLGAVPASIDLTLSVQALVDASQPRLQLTLFFVTPGTSDGDLLPDQINALPDDLVLSISYE